MADETFNPHHKWLGIAPDEMPCDHYRLLAIGRFESDPDVIEHAADQRMAHLRRLAIGSRSDLAETLLNELSAAKLELLTPDRKKAYDAALKAKDEEAKKAAAAKKSAQRSQTPRKSAPSAKVLPVATPLEAPAEPAIPEFSSIKPARGATSARTRRKSSNGPIIAILVLGVVVVGGGALFVLTRPSGKEPSPSNDVAERNTGVGKLSPAQTEHLPKPRPSVTAGTPDNLVQPPNNSDATSTAKLPPPEDSPPPIAEIPSSPDPVVETSTSTPAIATPIPDEPTRQAIPLEAAQKTAREKLQALYALDKPRKPDEKATLAAQLLEAAGDIKDPAEQYVVLEEARLQATQGAKVELAIKAVQLLGKDFEISEPELALAVVSDVRVPTSDMVSIRALIDAALTYLRLAGEKEEFATALALADAGIAAARRIKDVDTAKQIVELKKQLAEQSRRYDAVVAARTVLESQPDDPQANGIVGRYDALVKGDWPRGLAHLSHSDDEPLAELAQRDLAAPTTQAEQQSLAADWWSAAEKAAAEDSAALFARAAYWYEQILPQLKGVERAHVEKRLMEAEKITGAKSALASLPREQLIAYWKFDESQGSALIDSAGGHSAELAGVRHVPGVFGTALQLEERSEFAVRAAGFFGVTGTGPRTVAFWLRTETFGGIISWGDDTGWWIVHVDHEEGGQGKLRISANGYVRGTTLLNDGRWRHIAVVLPEGAPTHEGIQIYVDGKREQSTVFGSKQIETGKGEVTFGTALGIRSLAGAIDEMRIYARGLSETEIARLARPPAK